MDTAIAIAAAVFFSSGLASFGFYEALVKRQHEVAPEAWEADGRPPGFVWQVQGTSVMRSWTRGAAYGRWLFSTPDWLAADPKARAMQRRLRFSWTAGMAAWLVIMVVGFWPGR